MKHFYFFLFTFFAFNLSFGQEVTELYFSKYAEGSSNNKFVEIYNGTDQTISLSGYAYPTVSNAPTNPGVHEYWNDFEPGAEILPGDVYIIAHPSANAAILQEADETYTYMSNGDDGMALAFGTEDNYVVLDWIGDFNGDPGSGWEVAGVSNATQNKTLIRKSTVCGPNDDWADAAGTSAEDSEWIVQPQDTWDGLGSYTGCVSNPDPTLSITSPSDGTEFIAGTTSVTLSLSVLDFTVGAIGSGADGHIHWSVNGENQPMKYDLSDENISVSDGESYTIYVELVDDSHQPITPATNQTVTFTVAEPDPSLPIYEGFDYSLGTLSGPWSYSNSGDQIDVESGNLTYEALETSTGNHVTFSGAGQEAELNFSSVGTGNVYASFLFQVTDQSSMTDLTDGGYFAVLGAYDSRLWVRPNPDASSTTFDIGFGYESSNPQTTTETYEIGETIMIVMDYNLGTGTTRLWINPTQSDLSSSTPPNANLTAEDVDTNGNPNASSISKFILRQDSNGETPVILFDELRLGTTWDNVTPESLSLSDSILLEMTLHPNPTNTGFVTIKSNQMGAVQAQVFDLLGKEVINAAVNNDRMDVSNLNAGVYVVKLTQNKNTTTKKLIIQ
jgi:hypothetical protein